MKRKSKSNPTAILTADWHVRRDRPICRTDDYMEAQKRKILFIQNLALKYGGCPILIAGDVGNKPMWGDKLLNWFIERQFKSINYIAIAGQHDLPNHRLDKWEEAGIGVLSKSLENFEVIPQMTNAHKELFDIYSFPYSEKIESQSTFKKRISIAICHMMVIKSQKDKLWPDQQANSAKKLLKKFPCYDLIVTGDNHQSFAIEYEGRWLVNPGSMMRMSADQIDHKPSVYLWWAESNRVERVYLPIEDGVISREHIEESEQRNERIGAFVSRLEETEELGLSYEENMERFLKTNKIKKKIRQKIWESME